MTPSEFYASCEATIEYLALFTAHHPDDAVKGFLDRVLAAIRPSWGQFFKELATPEEIDEVVRDIGVRVQKRRREIERAGYGRA